MGAINRKGQFARPPATSSLAISLTCRSRRIALSRKKKKRAEHRSWSELSASMVRDLQALAQKEHAADSHPQSASSSEISLVAHLPCNNLGTPCCAAALLLPLARSGLSEMGATTPWIYTPTDLAVVWRQHVQPLMPLVRSQMRPQKGRARQAESSSACICLHCPLSVVISGTSF